MSQAVHQEERSNTKRISIIGANPEYRRGRYRVNTQNTIPLLRTATAAAAEQKDYCTHTNFSDSEAVLGVWLPAPLPTPRALPDHGAIWPLAIGVEKDLGGIDV